MSANKTEINIDKIVAKLLRTRSESDSESESDDDEAEKLEFVYKRTKVEANIQSSIIQNLSNLIKDDDNQINYTSQYGFDSEAQSCNDIHCQHDHKLINSNMCAPAKLKSKEPKSGARGDLAMKQYATSTQTVEHLRVECTCGKQCVASSTLKEMNEVRTRYWGPPNDEVVNRADRNDRNMDILKRALTQDEKGKAVFKFFIGTRNICELGYLIILGLISVKSKEDGTVVANAPPGQWTRTKEYVLNSKQYCEIFKPKRSKTTLQSNGSKHTEAVTYITLLAEKSYSCDDAVGVNLQGVKILPFNNVSELYTKYVREWQRSQEWPSFREPLTDNLLNDEDSDNDSIAGDHEYDQKVPCCLNTFSTAYESVKEKIKFKNSRGSFETCSICNQIDDHMRKITLNWSKKQIDMIISLKDLHISQQAKERQDMENRMKQAAQSIDDEGNPEFAFLFPDGYSIHKTETPKLCRGAGKDKSLSETLSNRIMGFRVICGPIDTHFLYNLDDMVPGGCNIMIELMRTAINDLAVLLQNIALKLPRKLFLQFDNCGENKNKYMFTYLSILVQEFYFDSIQVNFLIVGHTHACIDQYFSCLSDVIYSRSFIGSPLALRNLFDTELASKTKPAINKTIHVYYDYKSWLDQVINQSIKYYQIPQVFVFTRKNFIACCQYKFLSTDQDFLPRPPQDLKDIITIDNLDSVSEGFRLSPFCQFGGENAVVDYLCYNESSSRTVSR